MNALRTLPVLNRPSRPSSPAPANVQVTTTTAGGMSLPPIITNTASEPGKPRARSLSRQITDKVSHLQLAGASVKPATLSPSQPVGGKTGPSPPLSRSATPRLGNGPLPGAPPVTVADSGAVSGFMDGLGLRLNEVANKASAGVDYKAKRGFKKGSGWFVGEAVVKELPDPASDAYLMRAVLRTAVRSLSIYITRLESLLLPALIDPAFIQSVNLHISINSQPLNPIQYFALSVAHAAWETCEVLEQTIETGRWPRFVQESLRPVMDKLDLIVGKVVQPMLLGLKRDLVASLSRTEGASPPGGKVIGLTSLPAPSSNLVGGTVPLTKEHSNQPLSRLTKPSSQSGSPRQLSIPSCLQHFASRIDGSRKVLELIAAPCQDDGEGWITGVVVAVVWKGMCVLFDRDASGTYGRPPSPNSVSKALNNLAKDKDGTLIAPSAISGAMTAKLTTMLPSRGASRPPSPPHQSRLDPMTHALVSLEGLIKRLVGGLVQPPSAVPPTDATATEHIAREALEEAVEALASMRTVSAAMYGKHGSSRMVACMRRLRDDIDEAAEEALDDAAEDLPAVSLFALLHQQANASLAAFAASTRSEKLPELRLRTPTEIWGWTHAEFDRQVLSGFGPAEEWGRRVMLALKPEVERVLKELAELGSGTGTEGEKTRMGLNEAEDWVKVLGLAGEARCGVKVPGAT